MNEDSARIDELEAKVKSLTDRLDWIMIASEFLLQLSENLIKVQGLTVPEPGVAPLLKKIQAGLDASLKEQAEENGA